MKYTLRDLCCLVLVVATCCGLHAYRLAMLVCVVVGLHFLLLLLGAKCAKRFPRNRNPFASRKFANSSSSGTAFLGPALIVIGYLTVFLGWQLLLIAMLTPRGISSEWYSATELGPSLHTVQNSTLLALNLYLYFNYFAHCYGTGKLSPAASFLTAGASTLLALTHFAVPSP